MRQKSNSKLLSIQKSYRTKIFEIIFIQVHLEESLEDMKMRLEEGFLSEAMTL